MDALEPIGVGSAEVESLSSYVQRLAAAHGTFPGQLVFRYLAWTDRGLAHRMGLWAERPGRVRIGFNINSFSLADVWLRQLQRATGRGDLIAMTTRRWDVAFPTRGFQVSTQAWCPVCLQEDLYPYHRLRWTNRDSRVCLRHQRSLQRRCVRCDRAPPVLHDRSHVTVCPWCAGDLRIPMAAGPAIEPDHFEYWAAREVGEIIARAAEWHREVTWRPAPAFKLMAKSAGIGGVGALARFLGISKLTVWYWLVKGTRPSLGSTLQVYHRFGFSLAGHLFSSVPTILPVRPSALMQGELPLRRCRRSRKFDWAAVEKSLQAEIERPIAEAPTFIAVAKRLGIARRTLREHAPALCREISRRYRQRWRQEAEAREHDLAVAIKATLKMFACRGDLPKWRAIEAAMGRPGLFNSRYARLALMRASQHSGPLAD